MHRVLKIIIVNLAVAAVLVVVLGLAAEFLIRMYVPTADHRGLYERTDDARKYVMKPSADMVRQGVGITTNSDGFRDREFNHTNEDPRKILTVLGDSYTFGQGVPQGQTYPALLEKILNRTFQPDRFRVWNLGVSGYNTAQEKVLLQSFILPRRPFWVLVGYHINDWEETYKPPHEHHHISKKDSVGEWIQEILDGNVLLVSFLKPRLGNLMRMVIPSWHHSSYVSDTIRQYTEPGEGWKRASGLLSLMNEECRRNGVGFTVAVLPMMYDYSPYPLEEVHQVIVSYCHAEGIDCVDIGPYFKGKNTRDLIVSVLDPHPNGAAQMIFAEVIASHLRSVMPRNY